MNDKENYTEVEIRCPSFLTKQRERPSYSRRFVGLLQNYAKGKAVKGPHKNAVDPTT